MIDIKELNLRDEIPENLLRDQKVSKLADALTGAIEKSSSWVEKINYTLNLRNLPEEIIDHLLWEAHVEDDEGLILADTLEKKINLLEKATDLHRIKGTPYAIESVLEAVNLKGNVEEWFEYNSLPYHFLVELDLLNDFRNIDDVRRLVMHYKNKRSWFDGFVILITAGKFIVINDTYFYPVFYKDCGWFCGEKHFTQLIFKTINIFNQIYNYEVLYPVSERSISYIEAKNIEVIDNSYEYIKKLSCAGELELLSKKVTTQAARMNCKNKNYNYNVAYKANEKKAAIINGQKTSIVESTYNYRKNLPIGNEMQLLVKHVELHTNKFSLKEKSYDFEQAYPTCGEFYAEL